MGFDLGLELYQAMKRVANGGDPGAEAEQLIVRAPKRISLKDPARSVKRIRVARLWHSGVQICDIAVSTGAGVRNVYKIIASLRKKSICEPERPSSSI